MPIEMDKTNTIVRWIYYRSENKNRKKFQYRRQKNSVLIFSLVFHRKHVKIMNVY